MKHTPGPWRFNSATMDVETLVGNTVAFPRSGGFLSGDFETKVRANAHLIAAAPEMLEALEAVVKAGMIGSDVVAAQALARRALAKARGES